MDLSFFCDRIDDLIKAAEKRGSACTGFLDSEHQKYAADYLTANAGSLNGIRYLFYGGYCGAERRILVLFDPDFCGYLYRCGRCGKISDGADFQMYFQNAVSMMAPILMTQILIFIMTKKVFVLII